MLTDSTVLRRVVGVNPVRGERGLRVQLVRI